MLTILQPIIKSVDGHKVQLDASKLDGLKYESGPYTNPLEIKLIAYALTRVKGDYLEIGVNVGGTARVVCWNNPDKRIYGVDYVEGCTMHEKQRNEQPSISNAGRLCRDLPNFSLILENSWSVKLPENIGMAFIDADHSYQGVKNDTENVLSQAKPGTVVMWHDYQNDLHPEYMRVNRYIDNEVAPIMDIYEFEGTWLVAGIVK